MVLPGLNSHHCELDVSKTIQRIISSLRLKNKDKTLFTAENRYSAANIHVQIILLYFKQKFTITRHWNEVNSVSNKLFTRYSSFNSNMEKQQETNLFLLHIFQSWWPLPIASLTVLWQIFHWSNSSGTMYSHKCETHRNIRYLFY